MITMFLSVSFVMISFFRDVLGICPSSWVEPLMRVVLGSLWKRNGFDYSHVSRTLAGDPFIGLRSDLPFCDEAVFSLNHGASWFCS